MSLAADLRRALDPVSLAESIGFVPDSWQADMMRSTSRRILANCSRQVGKTEAASLLCCARAIYHPGSTILAVAPSMRQSGELFRRIVATYRKAGRPVPAEQESATSLRLENESRIISLPGTESTVRGYAASVVVVDEASRVPDELYEAISPMLAVTNGTLIAMSTPFGQRGWWYREWTQGGPSWQRFEVPASSCPRISAEFLAEQRASLGEWFYAQEFDCQFRDSTEQMFSSELVEAMFAADLAPLTIDAPEAA